MLFHITEVARRWSTSWRAEIFSRPQAGQRPQSDPDFMDVVKDVIVQDGNEIGHSMLFRKGADAAEERSSD